MTTALVWLATLCALFLDVQSRSICCETKTFYTELSARKAGYDPQKCQEGRCKAMSEKIKHILVLMLENRSFDHMLGHLSATRDDIDGCTPEMGAICSNPVDPNDPESERIPISYDAVWEQPADPEHKLSQVTYQVFGTNSLGNMIDIYPAPMNGFVASYDRVNGENNGSFIMRSFNEKTLPILSQLANEYGVIDHWFSAIPGETQPNRVMAMRGHTNGYIRNSDMFTALKGFEGLNMFSMLDEYGPDDEEEPWNVFSGDFPNALWMKSTRDYPERFHNIDALYERISNGSLPLLSWIEPSYFDIGCLSPSTSEHANQHDVRNGEEFVKKIYETLRKSPIWQESLLFIYYDEHGGFFDHVPPPTAPNPDGVNTAEEEYPYGPPFDFKRLGVRIPAVLVSPLIRKETTDPVIAKNGESQYCHSSLIHTIRKNYAPDAPALSAREDWSLTFEHLINLNVARDDTPEILLPDSLPDWRECDEKTWLQIKNINITDVMLSEAEVIAGLLGKTEQVKEYLADEPTLGQFVKDSFAEWLKKRIADKFNLEKCQQVGCLGQFCADAEKQDAENCEFKCEYGCHDYRTCRLNVRSGECEWMTNVGGDLLKYKACVTLCESMEKLKSVVDSKIEL